MELKLRRTSSGAESTLGEIHDVTSGPKFQCYTLEDQHNEPKVPGETRIPPGRYQINLRTEGGMHTRYGRRFPWHRGMLWLQDVPGFEWIYIHVGNKHGDSEGCILVGDGQTYNPDEGGGWISSSVSAYRRLYARILEAMDGGDSVYITIGDYA